MPTADSEYEELDRILHDHIGDNIRDYDQDMASRRPSDINLYLTSRGSRLADIGPLITRFDRGVRRSVTIFRDDSYYLGEPRDRPRPISSNAGGLELTEAAPGSFHMLLKAYGEVLSLLTSKPLQALTAVIALGQGVGSIRFWHHRKKDALAGISARQALDVLKEFGGNAPSLLQGDTPDLEVRINPAIGDLRGLHASPPVPRPEVPPFPPMSVDIVTVGSSRDIIVRGQRITYVRNYPDGTQDIIYVDG